MITTQRSERHRGFGTNFRYQSLDATNLEELQGLGSSAFDAAICNMVIMDMPVIDPLLKGLHWILRPNAPVVFTLPHPAFTTDSTRGIEKHVSNGVASTHPYIKVERYLSPATIMTRAIPGEGALQPYWHRPLHVLFKAFFDAGFVVDGLEEPNVVPPSTYNPAQASVREHLWYEFAEFPFILGIRLRKV